MTVPNWLNPGLTLGMRCVLLAKEEMTTGVAAQPYGQPNTGPRVREYLEPCVRDLNGDGAVVPEERLGLREGNWCAAFASWCMTRCLLDGEEAPHLYRAGVVEIVADAQARGLWHTTQEVLADKWQPHIGDLAIWDRSEPGRPATAWWRHVNRIARWTSNEGMPRFTTIGGNENRRICMTDQPPKALESKRLIGFVSYYGEPLVVTTSPEQRQNNLNLISAFVRAELSRKVDVA